MDVLDIARWQFGITTVYHFLFVPITIGLSALVAGFETAWVRTGKPDVPAADEVLRQALPDQLRDRRRHRHRAGVPVRHELERLLALRRRHLRRPAGHRGAARVLPRVDVPRPVDLRLGQAARASCTPPCIWLVHIGTMLSAYFILAANSWMQHPVGYRFNPDTGRAELNDIWRRAHQLDRAGHVPAHDHRGLPDRRRVRGRRRAVAARAQATPDVDRAMFRRGGPARVVGDDRRRHRRRRSPATCRARS